MVSRLLFSNVTLRCDQSVLEQWRVTGARSGDRCTDERVQRCGDQDNTW